MEIIATFTFIMMILFVVIVLPIWIVMHYGRSKRMHTMLAREDRHELRELEEKAEAMAERIDTLESILDHETPKWRRKSAE